MNRLDVGRCVVCGDDSGLVQASGYDFEYATTQEEFHYVECLGCGHIYLRDPPAPDALSTIYPPSYLPYNFSQDLQPVVRWSRELLQRRKAAYYRKLLPADASVLEVGAGSGLLMEALCDYGSPAWRLTANDFNGERLERLLNKGVALATGKFEDIDFQKSFDVIIMNQTIEHFYDPDAVLRRCRKLLTDRGMLVIETPNHEALDKQLFAKRYWGGYHIPRHFHVYSYHSIARHLHKHGFEVTRIEYLLSPSFWIQSLHHCCVDRGWQRLRCFFTINNVPLVVLFCGLDWALSRVGRTSNMRVVAKRFAE